METAVFKAVCPLEIGDTVAIGVGKTAAGVRTGILSASGHGSSCGGYGINTHGHGHFNNALSEKRQNSIQI